MIFSTNLVKFDLDLDLDPDPDSDSDPHSEKLLDPDLHIEGEMNADPCGSGSTALVLL